MRATITLTVVSASAILIGMSAIAAEDKSSDHAGMVQGGHMHMSETMQGCMKHCQATTAAIDETVKLIDAAKDTDDVAKLKDALGKARRQLTDMKSHMTECMQMMEKMEGMHGSASGSPVDGLVKAYLKAEALLVADKFDGVPEQFEKINQGAAELGKSENTKTAEPARQIASASKKPGDIDSARSELKQISKALASLVQVTPPSASVAPALYEAYCPMAKASWLQTSEQIQNPYMGQSMPECGKIQRKIETAGPKGGADAAGGKSISHQTVEVGCASCIIKVQGVTGCSKLAGRVGGQTYLLQGADINAHKSGMCDHAKTAEVSGRIEGNTLVLSEFKLKD